MSMSMRDTLHNEQAKEDIKDLMKSTLKKPNAAVGQSGLQVQTLLFVIILDFFVDICKDIFVDIFINIL